MIATKSSRHIACCTFAFASLSASAQAIELSELITSLLPAASQSATLYDWSAGSSPIRWKTPGIEASPPAQEQAGYAYRRMGSVQLKIQGKVTHYTDSARKAPGTWRVTLLGPRAGFSRVEIESDVTAEGLGEGFVERQKARLSAKAYKCTSQSASFGNRVYELRVPGKKPAWVSEAWSCGSAGCSSSFALVFSKADADQIPCDS